MGDDDITFSVLGWHDLYPEGSMYLHGIYLGFKGVPI